GSANNVGILLNNCAPTIMAGTVTRQQGSPSGAAVTIATVSDAEDTAGSLSVAVIAGGTATGITLGSLTNTNGTIKATAAASCTLTVNDPATCSPASFGFSQPAGSPVSAGSRPFSVAVGDFNGDGKQDLAVANFGPDNVTILLGNGSGGFSPATGSPFGVGDG